jgi:hypothetical protein
VKYFFFYSPVFRNFVETALLDVDAAVGQQVVDDLHVALLARQEEWRGAILGPGVDVMVIVFGRIRLFSAILLLF